MGGHTFGKIANRVMGVKMNAGFPQISSRGSKSVVLAGSEKS